jgi:hypothetical protein
MDNYFLILKFVVLTSLGLIIAIFSLIFILVAIIEFYKYVSQELRSHLKINIPDGFLAQNKDKRYIYFCRKRLIRRSGNNFNDLEPVWEAEFNTDYTIIPYLSLEGNSEQQWQIKNGKTSKVD